MPIIKVEMTFKNDFWFSAHEAKYIPQNFLGTVW